MRERKNHLVSLDVPLHDGARVLARCGVMFTVDANRDVFEHEDCQRCDKIAKAYGYQVFKTKPIGVFHRGTRTTAFTTSITYLDGERNDAKDTG